MAKHKAVIVGAGRIGAGWNWNDDAYTHAGAYLALRDRVELVGFVDPDPVRGQAAFEKWGVPWAESLNYFDDFDIVSVCTPDDMHFETYSALPLSRLKGIYMEKPFSWPHEHIHAGPAIQVGYLRRADRLHKEIATHDVPREKLVVYGKDDETTRCHFRDLARFWKCELDYRPFNGPCAYALDTCFFDNGGINPGECMVGMLRNLLDAVDNGTELWSPPYVE